MEFHFFLIFFLCNFSMYHGTREKVIAWREIRVIKRELLYGSHRDGEHTSTDECEHDRLYIQRNYVIVSQNRGLRD